jgi:D-sedoheptulose 7-phosphate isomerase
MEGCLASNRFFHFHIPERSLKTESVPLQIQTSGHVAEFFAMSEAICGRIELSKIEALAVALKGVRERGGRLFMLGVGGSAGNCSHAVNDFRKLCCIEAYSPVDNVSELTARANDEGWETIFAGWLEVSRLGERDAIFVLSVGGGDVERNISMSLVRAIEFARSRGAKVFGIVGKEAGYTARNGDVVVVIPEVKAEWVTPLSEAFQAVVWHCLVSHPALQVRKTTW